jgi:hypothetical protein
MEANTILGFSVMVDRWSAIHVRYEPFGINEH